MISIFQQLLIIFSSLVYISSNSKIENHKINIEYKQQILEQIQNDKKNQNQNGSKRNLANPDFISPWQQNGSNFIPKQEPDIQPIRITIDTSPLDSLNNSQASLDQINFIKDQLNVAKAFYQKRLKVVPLQSNIKFTNFSGYKCVQHPVTSQEQVIGISNSDFHMFATASNEPQQGYLAWAAYCEQEKVSDGFGRPIAGQVHFNTAYIQNLDNASFAQTMETTLHEIAHALVFSNGSGGLFKHFRGRDGNYHKGAATASNDNVIISQVVRGLETDILTTPFVREWTATHFGCNQINENTSGILQGLQLENQGAPGSLGSHWERTLMYDEIMTASRLGPSKTFSGATYAIFKDSGWYIVNDEQEETLQWGYKKGCDFIQYACQGPSQFSEFCEFNGSTDCSGGREGKGVCINDSSLELYFMDDCGIVNPYGNSSCIDSTDSKNDSSYEISGQSYLYYGEEGNYDSRCFESTFGSGAVQCYRYECTIEGNIEIYFRQQEGGYKNEKALCSFKGQIHENLAGFQGVLTCPDPITFCKQGRKFCKNWYSRHGYCSNGVCVCQLGYAGEDCSIIASLVASCNDNSLDINNGYVLNNNESQCILEENCCNYTNFPNGCNQFPNILNRKCSICDQVCDTCMGGGYNQCKTCVQGLFLFDQFNEGQGECVISCQEGYYENINECTQCINGSGDLNVLCKSCIDGNGCIQCFQNYWLDIPSSNTNNEILIGYCKQACTGTYKDQENKQCFTGGCPLTRIANGLNCEKCSNNKFMLIDYNLQTNSCVTAENCADGTYPDTEQQICQNCNQECQTCFGGFFNQCYTCTVKNDNSQKYLFANKCLEKQNCPLGSYGGNYLNEFNETIFKCLQCDKKCFSCTDTHCLKCMVGYFYNSLDQTCNITCPTGYFKNQIDNQCTNCHDNCQECSKESDGHCLSCKSGKSLLIKQKKTCVLDKDCPSGMISHNQICTNCHYSCLICDSISQYDCKLCREGYYRFTSSLEQNQTKCIYICPKQYYGAVNINQTELECKKCHSSCLKCNGDNNNNCTQCDENHYLTPEGQCVLQCPSFLFTNTIFRVCSQSIVKLSYLLITITVSYLI